MVRGTHRPNLPVNPMRSSRTLLPALVTTLVLAPALVGCEAGVLEPEPVERADLVGSYQATTFTSTVDDQTTDHLDAGATLTLTLGDDGTTTGRLFVPGGAEDGGDLDAPLDGTWSFDADEDQVTFDHPADTFVRDMTFSAIGVNGLPRIRGTETFGDATLEVVLDRT